jgi:hypothetical protein
MSKKSRRLGWILSCLKFSGRFGPREKAAVSELFSVSEATISRDQYLFFDKILNNDTVILSGGKLEAINLEEFSTPNNVLEPSLGEWLKVILGSKFIEMTGAEKIHPSDWIIRIIVTAIQDRRPVFIKYVSRSSEYPTSRYISPHAIVNVAGRYHARCFDHSKGRYGDFVLTRILMATCDRSDMPNYNNGYEDKDWKDNSEIIISLRDTETSIIGKLDYGIGESRYRKIKVKKALARYIIDSRHEGFSDPIEIREA